MSIFFEDVKKFKYLSTPETGENTAILIKYKTLGICTSVPLDPNNVNYQQIKQKLDAGEITIEDAD
jgi:hypothetical protein|tara:strand:- start:37 stop:234 length:198 start_codon:yes stop_codon:yes gene_type:complete